MKKTKTKNKNSLFATAVWSLNLEKSSLDFKMISAQHLSNNGNFVYEHSIQSRWLLDVNCGNSYISMAVYIL